MIIYFKCQKRPMEPYQIISVYIPMCALLAIYAKALADEANFASSAWVLAQIASRVNHNDDDKN